jgi:hypothetical protein
MMVEIEKFVGGRNCRWGLVGDSNASKGVQKPIPHAGKPIFGHNASRLRNWEGAQNLLSLKWGRVRYIKMDTGTRRQN